MQNLIFGCGYLGQRVADRWLAAGQSVLAVTRSARRADELRRRGLEPLVADVTQPSTLVGLPRADCVLYAVGFDRTAGPSMCSVYVEGLANVLAALPPATGRIIYISSTGVYGQTDGVWVDETSACEPKGENGRICLEAEQALVAHPLAPRSIRLRLAGLYGPGRIPRRDALSAGEPIAAPAEGYLNLIHVDDAVEVVSAVARCPVPPPRLYTVADGCPFTRREYYAELARLLGGPPPRFVTPSAESPSAMRAESDKRVACTRLLTELGIELRYPSCREGLAAIVAAESV